MSKIGLSPLAVQVIINARLNSEYRLSRLQKLLKRLEELGICHFSVRIRGDLQEEASIWILKTFPLATVYTGSTYGIWQLDTLQQVSESDLHKFLVLQEDHYPICSYDEFRNVIRQLIIDSVDICPLSGFRIFESLRNEVEESTTVPQKSLVLFDANNRRNFQALNKENRYPFTLISFFSRSILEKRLTANHPILRKYPLDSPFDFELRDNTKFLYPFRFALPRAEIFACIDDDMKVPGSSLQSRGLYPQDVIRSNEQFSSTSSLQGYIEVYQDSTLLCVAKRLLPKNVKHPLKVLALGFLQISDTFNFTIRNIKNIIKNRKFMYTEKKIN